MSTHGHNKLGRRAFLRGTGAALVGLPFLFGLQDRAARAAGEINPKRVIFVRHGQGTLLQQWLPFQEGRGYEMSPLLNPLAAHRERMLVLSGISNRARNSQLEGNGHIPAERSLFTATPFASSYSDAGGIKVKDQQVGEGNSYGPSIDQVLGERLSGEGQLRSLHLAVRSDNARFFWSGTPGNTQPISSETDPARVFDSIFGGITFPGDTPVEPTRQQRFRSRSSSILDRVASSYSALKRTLPAEDRVAMENHAEQIRQLEKDINIQIDIEGACMRPELSTPEGYQFREEEWAEVSVNNQIELLTMAFACDVTRVATLQLGNAHAPQFPFLDGYQMPLDGYGNWHDMIHKQSDERSAEGLFRGFEWYASKVEHLITRLMTTREGEGSLLDNTLVVWLSEFGNGGAHRTDNLPVVLLGDLGGTMRTGEHMYMGDKTTNDLWLTLLKLYGGADTSFGLEVGHNGEELVRGPLEIHT